jgi:uncharacterized protein
MPKSQCGNEGNKTEAWGAVIAGILVLLLPALAHGASPSFDCKRAAGWAEKGVCSDDQLAALDVELDAPYRRSIQLLSAPRADAADHAAEMSHPAQRIEWAGSFPAFRHASDHL